MESYNLTEIFLYILAIVLYVFEENMFYKNDFMQEQTA